MRMEWKPDKKHWHFLKLIAENKQEHDLLIKLIGTIIRGVGWSSFTGSDEITAYDFRVYKGEDKI